MPMLQGNMCLATSVTHVFGVKACTNAYLRVQLRPFCADLKEQSLQF